jgi:hypothetical protein
MASERQTAANRSNSQLSTGPRSVEGKARIAANAMKHGLTGKQMILPGEDPAEFDAFRSDLITDLAPEGALEEILAEKIVADVWRLRRIPQLESAFYWREERQKTLSAASGKISSCETNPMKEAMESFYQSEVLADRREAHQAAVAKWQELRAEPVPPLVPLTSILEKLLSTMSNLERYETTLSRSWLRTLHELQRLQAIRAGERVPAPAAVDVEVSINGNGAVNPEVILQNKAN